MEAVNNQLDFDVDTPSDKELENRFFDEPFQDDPEPVDRGSSFGSGRSATPKRCGQKQRLKNRAANKRARNARKLNRA